MVNLDSLLNILTTIVWVIFAGVTVISFWRVSRRYGVKIGTALLLSWRVILPLLGVIGLNLLSLAIVFIPPQYVGVVVSLISDGGIRKQPLSSGLHLVVPLAEEVVQYPIYWQTYTMSGKPFEGQNPGNDSIVARTKDGQEVTIDCSVIFRVNPDKVVRVHVDWQDRYLFDLVRPLARGLIRDFVSRYEVREVNSDKRQILNQELEERISMELQGRGFMFDKFLLRNIAFSQEYATAVEQKQVAKEGVERTEQEAIQMRNLALGRARAIKIEAEAQKEALQQLGAGLAGRPDLLTYHYIEKLGPSIRTMLVPNDIPFILPLPTPIPDLSGTLAITDTLNITATNNSP